VKTSDRIADIRRMSIDMGAQHDLLGASGVGILEAPW
jgi:hypothetical protein